MPFICLWSSSLLGGIADDVCGLELFLDASTLSDPPEPRSLEAAAESESFDETGRDHLGEVSMGGGEPKEKSSIAVAPNVSSDPGRDDTRELRIFLNSFIASNTLP
mmetsp:Transcript_12295/g.17049  ORF Transcript_12295/g.17049 Transcript_12295/m.17049 type:complete len:106 (+) Transcript_12295:376-693(+)